MQEKSQIDELPMSVEILSDLVDEGAITRQEIADLLNMSVHSSRPYTAFRELRYSQLRAIFRRARSSRVREAFIDDLCAGTDQATTPISQDLDVDGDGDVDLDDLLASCIQSVKDASSAMTAIHAACMRRKSTTLTPGEALDLLAATSQIVSDAVTTKTIIGLLTAERKPAKQAIRNARGQR